MWILMMGPEHIHACHGCRYGEDNACKDIIKLCRIYLTDRQYLVFCSYTWDSDGNTFNDTHIYVSSEEVQYDSIWEEIQGINIMYIDNIYPIIRDTIHDSSYRDTRSITIRDSIYYPMAIVAIPIRR